MIVNGKSVNLDTDADAPLLYALRNELGLRGSRFGCGEGNCGACAVLINGLDEQSCQVTVRQAANRCITTIEGLIDDAGIPGRVQQALIHHRAGQCGYCLSGIVMRIEAALMVGATRGGIVKRLNGNLCRCGSHVRILRAVDSLLEEQVS
ncbi:2Fe-2S iron-sulfur cluster-binding protein [Sphingobium sp. AN558]|uniref:(2Fe-2S)-binding protein n=1 Tax=Sphingobium sp. AN558 TaxID=3133442 RepID=UPI0030BF6DCA